MFFRITFLLSFSVTFLFQVSLPAQEIPLGSWQDHLPYSDAVSVTKNGPLVYCAANSALFIYDEQDHSIERLSLVNGLSDIGISKIKYVPTSNSVVVAYQNGNVDIILADKSIFNLPFIKNSTSPGNKEINHIEVVNEFAYLSTGVGIIVLNTNKLEFSDTYNYSSTGSSIITNATTFDNTNIYAASDQGVYFANKNAPNLSDFNAWSQITALGNLKYNGVVFFANQLFVNYDDDAPLADTIFRLDAGSWKKFPASANGNDILGLSISNDKLLVPIDNTLTVYDTTLIQSDQISKINGDNIFVSEGILDENNIFWIANRHGGLAKALENNIGEQISPNSPTAADAFKIAIVDGDIWKIRGSYNRKTFEPNYFGVNPINYRVDNSWKNIKFLKNNQGNIAYDVVSIVINPSNKNQIYVGTWNDGLFELDNSIVTQNYDAKNSVLDSTFFGATKVGALAFDENNNLWATSSFATNVLAVKTPEDNWFSYSFAGFTTLTDEYHSLIIDDNSYKWLGMQNKNSIIVFNDNNTLDITNDDQRVLLNPGKNQIPGAALICMAKDLDGEIWLGTDEGIAVFYNPSAVFDNDIKAERILIQQDGQTHILLETEIITAITIDGANRKWIGTETSGIYLMSADGNEEIAHFTTDNSPLFSNNILSIAINQNNGEVFIGTEKGLISYKGTATEAQENFNSVFVYPNPVKSNFSGTIAIRGLMNDTDVKITDINGNIVYETTSLGGQATWNGNDMFGNRVKTGVYLLFNSTQDGEQKYAAKILFIQ